MIRFPRSQSWGFRPREGTHPLYPVTNLSKISILANGEPVKYFKIKRLLVSVENYRTYGPQSKAEKEPENTRRLFISWDDCALSARNNLQKDELRHEQNFCKREEQPAGCPSRP